MPAPRRWHLPLLIVGVALAHLWLANEVMPTQLGDGDAAAGKPPPRIDVAFVRELAPTAPPPAAAPARAAPRRAAQPAAAAASGAATALAEPPAPADASDAASTASAASDASPATTALAASAPPSAPAASAATEAGPTLQAAATTSAPAAASASSAPAADASAFDWPPSTRLSYTLSGNYRGPVEGQAAVEWLRAGTHYQVRMDVSIGPPFAPLLSRKVSSDGEITPQGLSPRRYDEENRVVLSSGRHQTILMDADRVLLPDGSALPRPPGLQDSASQFVQLTWLFTTQPQLLQPGRSVDFPLALPRRVRQWTYDVLGSVELATPAGTVAAVHVKPRPEPRAEGDKPGRELAAEMWVAPSLQYLPVRILIRQDADSWIDMLIERLPQQAAPTVPAGQR